MIHKRATFFPLTVESQFLKHLELYVAILYLLSLRKNVAAKSGTNKCVWGNGENCWEKKPVFLEEVGIYKM